MAAGEWIPYTKSLPRKPEVGLLAEATGMDRRLVVALLLEFWCWCDDETEDGFLPRLSVRSLSALHADIPETFFRTMSAVGWLVEAQDGIHIPNFGHWMGHSAKRRLKENRRKKESRASPIDATGPTETKHPPGKRTNRRTACGQTGASNADKKRPTVQDSYTPKPPGGLSSSTSATQNQNPPEAEEPATSEQTQAMIAAWRAKFQTPPPPSTPGQGGPTP